jgi:predicted ATPase/DNA-binding CsgD family transcriptional regulator
VKTAVSKGSASNLPVQLTPFIGREEELDELNGLLADPTCRLLTLVGPGGSGKTSLAIQAAREKSSDFADGVYFVALQPVSSIDLLVPAIADAMKFSLRGQEEPRVQLSDYLSGKHLLLVLDNFEHLVQAADLLGEILTTAPEVKLLVTTREALNLQEEWVCPVPGMGFDDAVQLFAERASRVKRGYSPGEDCGDIARLYQLVQGMPLAIELAASWVRTLPCAEIVREIERNLDFLATNVRNMPERHRSMRAVFAESWRLLSEEECDVFRRLSVFRGTFGRDAAEKVAGASLTLLSMLVDKSLLRPVAGGRYQVHELLRQYAMEKLTETPDNVERAQDAHCTYYSGFLSKRMPGLLGGRQVEAGTEIEAELDNIRAAWQWAVDHARTEELKETVYVLGLCWQFKARYAEAATALEGAARSLEEVEATDEIELTLAGVLVEMAWFHIRLGRLEDAQDALSKCQSIFARRGNAPALGLATDPRLALGVIATIKGEYAEAARHGEAALRTADAEGHPWNREVAHYVLARAALLQGRNEAAQEYASKANDIATELGDRWFMAYCLIELGNVACALGDLAAARDHYQASFDLRREFEDPEGMAVALTYLGEVALQQQSYAVAQKLFQQALSNYEEIHDKGGLAASLAGMGKAAVALEDDESARRHFEKALQLAVDIQHVPQILSIVTGTGQMLLDTGEIEGGLDLLTLAQHHPGSDHETRTKAHRLITLRADGPQGDERIQRNGLGDLEKAVSVLQESLSMASDLGVRALLERAASNGAAQPSGAAGYPDDLTQREVEVIGLVAQGRSNRKIAEELFITENTVANHVKNILSKTQTSNRTEAAAYAIEKGLVGDARVSTSGDR